MTLVLVAKLYPNTAVSRRDKISFERKYSRHLLKTVVSALFDCILYDDEVGEIVRTRRFESPIGPTYVSLAHKYPFIVVAFDTSPIGVDYECGRKFGEIPHNSFFSYRQRRWIAAAPSDNERNFRILLEWTRGEAVYKCSTKDGLVVRSVVYLGDDADNILSVATTGPTRLYIVNILLGVE